MNNTKNMLIMIISIVTLLSVQQVFSAPVIEIYNKTNESIQVDIAEADSKKDITTAYVGPDQQWNSGDRQTINLNTKLLMQFSTKTNPSPKAFIVDDPGKTKYLSWDSAKSQPLYPQTGPAFGLLGKTKSGLLLSNNVKAENIALTNPLAAPQMPTTKPMQPSITPIQQSQTEPSADLQKKEFVRSGPSVLTITNESKQTIGCYVNHYGAKTVAYMTIPSGKTNNVNLGQETVAILGHVHVGIISPFTKWPTSEDALFKIGQEGKKFKINLPGTPSPDLKGAPSPNLIWNQNGQLLPTSHSNNVKASDIIPMSQYL